MAWREGMSSLKRCDDDDSVSGRCADGNRFVDIDGLAVGGFAVFRFQFSDFGVRSSLVSDESDEPPGACRGGGEEAPCKKKIKKRKRRTVNERERAERKSLAKNVAQF